MTLVEINFITCMDTQSVQRLATGLKVRGSNGKFYAPVHTGPVAHQASYIFGTGSLTRRESGRGMTLTTHPI